MKPSSSAAKAKASFANLPTCLQLSDISGSGAAGHTRHPGRHRTGRKRARQCVQGHGEVFWPLGARFVDAAPGSSGVKPVGITGLVYGGVKGVTQLAGGTVNAVLSGVAPLVRQKPSSRQREAMLAVLNGVLGDDLQWRCQSDASAQHPAHDHGLQLAAELGYTPVYLHYNTGRHISANGQQLADLLEQLLQAWPQPVQELTLLTHSMGGLVARSACHYGELAGHAAWRRSAGRSGPRGGSATRQQPRHAPVCRHRPDSQRRHP